MPIMIRKPRASTFTVGCVSTKVATGPEATISTIIDRMTATAITQISFAMPTAVTIESIENTRLMSAICTTTAPKPASTLALASPSSPSRLAWISIVAL